MSLDRYRSKRDFGRTSEPRGERPWPSQAKSRRFVVQRHRATRPPLRLPAGDRRRPGQLGRAARAVAATRWNGAWPLIPRTIPLDYFDFEGVIPKGEYGGGDVIVWDWGTWEPEETDDPGNAVADRRAQVRLHGEKLRGRFMHRAHAQATTAARTTGC